MSVIKNLAVPYHAADSGSNDAPAAIQMILEEIGLAAVPTQAAIAAVVQANNTEPASFYSDPNGVQGALVNLKPAAFANTFSDYSYPTENQASRHITYTLHHYQVATATLVYSGGHWVVVKGVQTDVDPLANAGYSIEGFWIHNPWPDDPLPGAASDNVWIDYATWVGTYHTSVVYGATWLNNFVSVCDPVVGALGALKPAKRRNRADGRELLTPDQALQMLRLEVESLELGAHGGLALAGGQPGQPVLVQRLDQEDVQTYAIPWQDGNGVRALFHLDARFGLLREAAALRRAARWPAFSRLDLLRLLATGSLEVNAAGGRRAPLDAGKGCKVRLRRGLWCLQDALVWAPCWESRSAAFPFYVLSMANRNYFISTLDGRVYDRLHPFNPSSVTRGGA